MRTDYLKNVILLLLLGLAVLFGTYVFSYGQTAHAEECTETSSIEKTNSAESAAPCGFFTSLSIIIDSGDGKVIASVKNDFTLFPSTVKVIVQLYSSEAYTANYLDMKLESTNETEDLNMGSKIMTEAATGGVEKYWLARMDYKIDSKNWVSKETGVCRISANGEFLGFI